MRISLNLATRPFADISPALRQLRIAMAVLAAVCLLCALGLHLFDRQADAARAREHSLDGQLARIRAERQADEAMMHEPTNARLLDQAVSLNQLFDEKAFSWTLAMEAMETVLPAGVQVQSIEPIRAKDGHITLHLRVVGPRDRAVDLVSNLERSRRFLQPRIVGENAESGTGPNQRPEPVSASNRFDFDLLADYNPPSPGERMAARNRAKASVPSSADASKFPRSRVAPDMPTQHNRQPYTGPAQPGANPSQHMPGGPQ